jgi:hypothetical protein
MLYCCLKAWKCLTKKYQIAIQNFYESFARHYMSLEEHQHFSIENSRSMSHYLMPHHISPMKNNSEIQGNQLIPHHISPLQNNTKIIENVSSITI